MGIDQETQKQLIGGAILSSAICLHLLLEKRAISMTKCLYTMTGNEVSYSTSRMSILLGLAFVSAYISQNNGSLFDGASVVSGISIWGLIIFGLLLGLGANLCGSGFETQALIFLPQFHKPTMIAIIVMILSGWLGAYTAQQKPDFLNFVFNGSNDVGFQIDQQKGTTAVMIGSGVVFLIFVLYQKFNQNVSFNRILGMVISFLCGGLYALGIIYSGLVKKSLVQQGLNFADNWNPDVGISCLVAVLLNTLLFHLLNQHYSPSWDSTPDAGHRFWVGSFLFGFSWGILGLCIGPVLAVSATCVTQVLVVLLPSMMLGYELERIIDRIR